MLPRQRRTLFVFGALTYLGREVARFGRALGHRMVCVNEEGVPEFTEPWMHGVHWVTDLLPSFEEWPEPPTYALLYCDTALYTYQGRRRFHEVLNARPCRLIEAAESLRPTPRFILRSTVAQPLLPKAFTTEIRNAEDCLQRSDLPGAVLRLPLLYGPDRPDSVAAMVIAQTLSKLPFTGLSSTEPAALRVETAALAMLRAALEPDIEGLLLPEEIARIGDVMIAQGR